MGNLNDPKQAKAMHAKYGNRPGLMGGRRMAAAKKPGILKRAANAIKGAFSGERKRNSI